jgi:hypothetical protein
LISSITFYAIELTEAITTAAKAYGIIAPKRRPEKVKADIIFGSVPSELTSVRR